MTQPPVTKSLPVANYPLLLTPDSIKLNNQTKRIINLSPSVKVTDFIKHSGCPNIQRTISRTHKLFFVRDYYDKYGELSDTIVTFYLPYETKAREIYHRKFNGRAKLIYKVLRNCDKTLKKIEQKKIFNRNTTRKITETITIKAKANEIREELEHAYSLKAYKISLHQILVYSTTHIKC